MCESCGFIYWNNSRPTAGGVVEDSQGRVLLGRRGINPSKGLWDLPGGFLEPGEHPEAGFVRELLEESFRTRMSNSAQILNQLVVGHA